MYWRGAKSKQIKVLSWRWLSSIKHSVLSALLTDKYCRIFSTGGMLADISVGVVSKVWLSIICSAYALRVCGEYEKQFEAVI
jgi:hypothetical protein